MKKLFIISSLIILAIAGQSAIAQNNRGNGEGQRQRQGDGERMTFAQRQSQILESLTTSLSLTDDQVAKTKELNKKYDEKFTALRNSSSTPEERQAQRGEMRKLMDQYNIEFKALLTEEQAKKYETLVQQRRENSQRERQRPGNNSGERSRERSRTR